MREAQLRARLLAIAVSLLLGACGSSADGLTTAAGSPKLAHWTALVHVRRPLDLAGPRRDGSVVLAAAGHLMLLHPSGALGAFAPSYSSPGGEEPYIAMATAGRKGCSFGVDTVYALKLPHPHGVLAIDRDGRVRRFATLSAPGLEDGIAFDETGRFGYRLLVTINAGSHTTVDAIDCHGTVRTITSDAPRVEGGIAVAPSRFGRFAGDLIAPGEVSGQIFAITPEGKSTLVADSGLPRGNDIGVESEAFVPNLKRFDALLADRLTPGNRHPGDDVVLAIKSSALSAAGVRPFDLLIATEGAAGTDAIRCGVAGCQVLHVAAGPPIAHGEGHIAFLTR